MNVKKLTNQACISNDLFGCCNLLGAMWNRTNCGRKFPIEWRHYFLSNILPRKYAITFPFKQVCIPKKIKASKFDKIVLFCEFRNEKIAKRENVPCWEKKARSS